MHRCARGILHGCLGLARRRRLSCRKSVRWGHGAAGCVHVQRGHLLPTGVICPHVVLRRVPRRLVLCWWRRQFRVLFVRAGSLLRRQRDISERRCLSRGQLLRGWDRGCVAVYLQRRGRVRGWRNNGLHRMRRGPRLQRRRGARRRVCRGARSVLPVELWRELERHDLPRGHVLCNWRWRAARDVHDGGHVVRRGEHGGGRGPLRRRILGQRGWGRVVRRGDVWWRLHRRPGQRLLCGRDDDVGDSLRRWVGLRRGLRCADCLRHCGFLLRERQRVRYVHSLRRRMLWYRRWRRDLRGRLMRRRMHGGVGLLLPQCECHERRRALHRGRVLHRRCRARRSLHARAAGGVLPSCWLQRQRRALSRGLFVRLWRHRRAARVQLYAG